MKLSWKKIIPCLLVLAIVIIMLVTYGGPPESEDNSLQLVSPTPTEQTDASATKSSVSSPYLVCKPIIWAYIKERSCGNLSISTPSTDGRFLMISTVYLLNMGAFQ